MNVDLSDLMLKRFGLSQDQVDEVQMAVVEACITFFERPDAPDREVRVLLEGLGADGEPKGLQVTIQNSGVGLADAISMPGTEESSKAARRRRNGLRVIDGLMDGIDIQSDIEGTTLVMRKFEVSRSPIGD